MRWRFLEFGQMKWLLVKAISGKSLLHVILENAEHMGCYMILWPSVAKCGERAEDDI